MIFIELLRRGKTNKNYSSGLSQLMVNFLKEYFGCWKKQFDKRTIPADVLEK